MFCDMKLSISIVCWVIKFPEWIRHLNDSELLCEFWWLKKLFAKHKKELFCFLYSSFLRINHKHSQISLNDKKYQVGPIVRLSVCVCEALRTSVSKGTESICACVSANVHFCIWFFVLYSYKQIITDIQIQNKPTIHSNSTTASDIYGTLFRCAFDSLLNANPSVLCKFSNRSHLI